ncbi:MAG: glutaredoxin family protein [Burkholderiaceae bacterium]|nr:glutaredoxin family protein [Burkholderiaceae bacterium]
MVTRPEHRGPEHRGPGAGRRTHAAWPAIGLCLLTGAALAQTPYKVVTPDGRVTYTDRPAAAAPGAQVQPMRRDGVASGVPAAVLPVELRAPAARFPVTLYTSADCAPCDSGRRLLQQRGIPYGERVVSSDDDVAALQRITGGRSVPALMVGSQALRGFQESDWQSTLDLAGYPKESRLPRNWQPPQPEPLVARGSTEPKPPAAPEPAPAEPAFPTASPGGPEGIRF